VAQLIARGLSNREIADKLVVSTRTAEAHAEHIRSKLGVRNRTEIAMWAARNGLIPGELGDRRREDRRGQPGAGRRGVHRVTVASRCWRNT
jgi:hypothetical protein